MLVHKSRVQLHVVHCVYVHVTCMYIWQLWCSTSSTAPHSQRRPVLDLATIPSMPTNPNFTRNAPARSTYAYGTRSRPTPLLSQQYAYGPAGGASALQPAPGTGFFKRLIPSRFSKRYRYVCVGTMNLHSLLMNEISLNISGYSAMLKRYSDWKSVRAYAPAITGIWPMLKCNVTRTENQLG